MDLRKSCSVNFSEEAEAAQARVTQAEQRAEQLAAKLRELNIDPLELE